MPSHADIDPVDIAVFLPTIILVEMGHNSFRLQYRLVGTDIVIKCGVDAASMRIRFWRITSILLKHGIFVSTIRLLSNREVGKSRPSGS